MDEILKYNSEELKIWFTTDNKSGYKTKEKYLHKNYKELLDKIVKNSLLDDIPLKEKIYLYISGLNQPPICPTCKGYCSFKGSIKNGYNNHCSFKCSNSDINVINKKLETVKPKRKKIIEKTKQTNLKKYGVDNVMKVNKFKEKQKETIINIYNVENVFQIEEIKKKIKYKNEYNYREKIALLLNINPFDITIDGDDLIISNYCNKHKNFRINKNSFYVRKNVYNIENICTECNKIEFNSSLSENEINDYLNEIIDDKIINNDRLMLDNKELDIYIPSKKLAIEYNGLYWHSNHKIGNNYHLNKTIECEEQNIQLLHIFEDEWLYKKDIVKSIIKSKLGLIRNRIYGRKCIIKEITDNSLIKEFLNDNHIQGFVGSSVKLGLFYENKLVSLMTFGKGRKALGTKSIDGEYEMLRFCNILNTNVIGSASKLLKYFIKNYNPSKIVSFADRRYSNGNLYNQLGFKLVGETKPNYWYFKKNGSLKIRQHRFKFRKDILIKDGFNSNKTEFEIMEERNYLRIYDSGNLKYEMVL